MQVMWASGLCWLKLGVMMKKIEQVPVCLYMQAISDFELPMQVEVTAGKLCHLAWHPILCWLTWISNLAPVLIIRPLQ